MAELKETAINYIQNEPTCTVYTAQQKYISKILKYKEQYPTEVEIIHHSTEPSDSYITARVPSTWLKFVGPKKKVSEEQRQAMSERMKRLRSE